MLYKLDLTMTQQPLLTVPRAAILVSLELYLMKLHAHLRDTFPVRDLIFYFVTLYVPEGFATGDVVRRVFSFPCLICFRV